MILKDSTSVLTLINLLFTISFSPLFFFKDFISISFSFNLSFNILFSSFNCFIDSIEALSIFNLLLVLLLSFSFNFFNDSISASSSFIFSFKISFISFICLKFSKSEYNCSVCVFKFSFSSSIFFKDFILMFNSDIFLFNSLLS